MALTSLQTKQAKPKDKPYKLADDRGSIYLTPKAKRPKGQKAKNSGAWITDGDKRKTLALGAYPEVSLADARSKRDKARQQIQNELDPSDVKRVAKLAKTQSHENSFKALALEWLEINFDKQEWLIPSDKMKQDHIVPLAKQAIDALQSLLQLTGHRQ